MLRKKRWVFLILIGIVGTGVFLASRPPHINPGSYLQVPIEGTYTDAPAPSFASTLMGNGPKSLTDLLMQLQKASVDERLQGVILKITSVDFSLAIVQDMRDAIQQLRNANKQVIAWVTGEDTSGTGEYYLASAANQVYFSENTLLPLVGLRASYMFLGGMWEKLNVDMQVEQAKEYKSFGDFLTRKTMSQAHREMANSLLDNLNQQLMRDIAKSRGLSPEHVQDLINSPMLTPGDYQQAGLIDGTKYFDELLAVLAGPDGRPAPIVPLTVYEQVAPSSLGLMQGPQIAVVSGVGSINIGKSGWGATGMTIGSDTMTTALKAAADNDAIKAIVIRVDSPGGSALASDLIWHAVAQAQQVKPVIVSMSGAAASGGYYMSAHASRILAQPATLTGSIGIVFSHVNVQGLLSKLGIHSETLQRGDYARIFSNSDSWTAAEREQIQRVTESLYQRFMHKVAVGRKLPREEVDRIGRGRIWTGEQAKELGLVDELGGIATAIQVAKKAAGISPELGVELRYYPEPEGLLTRILQYLSQLHTSHKHAVLKDLPRSLQDVVDQLTQISNLQDGPLFTMPVRPRIR